MAVYDHSINKISVQGACTGLKNYITQNPFNEPFDRNQDIVLNATKNIETWALSMDNIDTKKEYMKTYKNIKKKYKIIKSVVNSLHINYSMSGNNLGPNAEVLSGYVSVLHKSIKALKSNAPK